MSCSPSYVTPPGHPGQIPNTLTCGVNPYVPLAYLEKCCAGPIRNVTSDVPADPRSHKHELFCIAYCPVKHNVTDNTMYSPELENFVKCLDDAAGLNVGVECGHVDLPPDNKSFIVTSSDSKNDTASATSGGDHKDKDGNDEDTDDDSDNNDEDNGKDGNDEDTDDDSDNNDEDNDKDGEDSDNDDESDNDKDDDDDNDKKSSGLKVSLSQVLVGACLFTLLL